MTVPKVLVVYPHTEAAERAYRTVVEPSVLAAAALPTRARDKEQPYSDLLADVDSLKDVEIVLVDITGYTVEAIYLVAYARALSKMVIVIAEIGTNIPYDLTQFLTFHYSLEALHVPTLREQLADLIASLLEGKRGAPLEAPTKPPVRNRVFISYSHRDSEYLKRLETHLRPLAREQLIDYWSDTQIAAGSNWKDEISTALAVSDVAVLLISADFLASDFITENELPPLLAKARDAGTLILPVLLSPSRFSRDPHLSAFQSVNSPTQPLSALNHGEREAVFDRVAMEVERRARAFGKKSAV